MSGNTLSKRKWDSKPLYEDPDFPANSTVLFRGGQRFGVEWKRPWEISENPVFISGDTSYNDIDQGKLGDCWFLSAVACLSVSPYKELLSRVIPKDQGFGSEYTGKFRFNFWQYGKWTEFVIDDRLPTYDGKLIYACNLDQPNEYWGPLLEKAFAKLYGNYNPLDGGTIHKALVDLTGGLGEKIPLKEQISDNDLADLLIKCQKMNSFMGGAVFNKQVGGRETVQASGLVEGHAYTVVKVKEVNTSKGRVVLLHIRNPHGKGEWKGPWSDRSPDWKTLSATDQKDTSEKENEGEFWISSSDFRKHFDELELCHLTPDGFTNGNGGTQARTQWEKIEHKGKWDPQSTAGGPPISFLSKKFWSNPQFELHVAAVDHPTTVVISLFEVQEYLRREENDISIGFSIFQFPSGVKPQRITEENYQEFSPRMVQSSGVYWPYRERTNRFTLEAGNYVIVPYTSRAGQEASFYLRIFAESKGSSPISTSEFTENVATPAKPTPKDIAALDKAFIALAGTAGAIDATELVQVLKAGLEAVEAKATEFSLETCRSLIALSNIQSPKGLIDQNGVHRVWSELVTWQEAFRLIDKDKNNLIDAKELKSLFEIIELDTAPAAVDALMKRYGGKREQISLDDFIQGISKALLLRGKYLELQRKGQIEISLSEWMTFGLSI